MKLAVKAKDRISWNKWRKDGKKKGTKSIWNFSCINAKFRLLNVNALCESAQQCKVTVYPSDAELGNGVWENQGLCFYE